MCFYVKKYQDRTDGSGDTLMFNLISVNIQQDNIKIPYIYLYLLFWQFRNKITIVKNKCLREQNKTIFQFFPFSLENQTENNGLSILCVVDHYFQQVLHLSFILVLSSLQIYLLMNRPRPFLNRYMLRKQLQITDTYHSMNMKSIKPITSKLMEHAEAVTINNTKRQKMKQDRESEIQRQNKILLNKIASANNKRSAYSMSKTINFRTRNNKSLNLTQRRKQEKQIYEENRRFMSILQKKKPTLNIQKLNKDWFDNKQVIKRLSNRQFYLTTFRLQDKNRRYSPSKESIGKIGIQQGSINKIFTIDRCQMKIKAAFVGQFLKISADCLYNGNMKEIKMPKQEAIYFIQEDCNGKMEELINKLKYDPLTDTLYIVSDSLAEVNEQDFRSYNPEITTKAGRYLDTKCKQKKSILKDTIERLKIQAGFQTIAEEKNQYTQKNSKIKFSQVEKKLQNMQEISQKSFDYQKQHVVNSSHTLENVAINQIFFKNIQNLKPSAQNQKQKVVLIQTEQMEDYDQKFQKIYSKAVLESYNI